MSRCVSKRSKPFSNSQKNEMFMCDASHSHGSRLTRVVTVVLRSASRSRIAPATRRAPRSLRATNFPCAMTPRKFHFSSQMHTSQHVYEYFTYVAPLCRARLLLYTTCDMQPIQCSPSPLDEGAPGRKILGPRRHPHGGAAWACSTTIGTAAIGWAITVAMTTDWAVPGWMVCIWVPTAGPSTLLGTLAALHAATA